MLLLVTLQHGWNQIKLRHMCSPVNLLHIFRTPFLRNTSRRLLLGVSPINWNIEKSPLWLLKVLRGTKINDMKMTFYLVFSTGIYQFKVNNKIIVRNMPKVNKKGTRSNVSRYVVTNVLISYYLDFSSFFHFIISIAILCYFKCHA